jgi:hypothetical protein
MKPAELGDGFGGRRNLINEVYKGYVTVCQIPRFLFASCRSYVLIMCPTCEIPQRFHRSKD